MNDSAPDKHRQVLFFSHHSKIIGGGEISLLTLIKGLKDADWEPLLVVPAEGEVAGTCPSPGDGSNRYAAAADSKPAGGHPGGSRGAPTGSKARAADHSCERIPRHVLHSARGSRDRLPNRVAHPDPRSGPEIRSPAGTLGHASIAISSAVRERLRPWRRAYENCRVIPNGLDLRTFVPLLTRDEARAALGLGDNAFVVTTVGRLVDFKRYDMFLDAMAMLRRKVPELRGVIVGAGPEKPNLLKRSSGRKISRRGRVSRSPGRHPGYSCGQRRVRAAVSRRGFGRVLIEAMAASLPAVAFDTAGPAEILEDGLTGLLLEPGGADALAAAGGPAPRRARAPRATWHSGAPPGRGALLDGGTREARDRALSGALEA